MRERKKQGRVWRASSWTKRGIGKFLLQVVNKWKYVRKAAGGGLNFKSSSQKHYWCSWKPKESLTVAVSYASLEFLLAILFFFSAGISLKLAEWVRPNDMSANPDFWSCWKSRAVVLRSGRSQVSVRGSTVQSRSVTVDEFSCSSHRGQTWGEWNKWPSCSANTPPPPPHTHSGTAALWGSSLESNGQFIS